MFDQGSRRLRIASIVAIATALLSAATPASAATPPLTRLAGVDRIATAVAVAHAHEYFNSYAVIARADAYPDALAGAALAGAYSAPLYLTASDHLDPRVLAELSPSTAGTLTIMLLGTSDVMSDHVAQQLQAAGFTNIQRLGGADRYGTAADIARAIDSWVPPEYGGACRSSLPPAATSPTRYPPAGYRIRLPRPCSTRTARTFLPPQLKRSKTAIPNFLESILS